MMEEEFEFKPLTEGLGFHKKVVDLREEQTLSPSQSTTGILPKAKNPERQAAASLAGLAQRNQPTREPSATSAGFHPTGSRPAASAMGSTGAPAGSAAITGVTTRAPSESKKASEVVNPSGRTGMAATLGTSAGTRPVGWTPALEKQSILETSPETRPIALRPVAASWPAAIFDSTMILGMTLLFSAVVFAITGIELTDLLEMLRADGAAQFATVILLIAVLEIYFVACRSFFGKTLGEWAFEYRLGNPAQQSRATYPLKVAWRALLIALTGFIVLPIIGTIAKRDVTGILTGVSLYAEQR